MTDACHSWQHCQIAGKPLEFSLPNEYSNVVRGRGNTPAYGKNVRNWAIRN
jgi:hypothetical protein